MDYNEVLQRARERIGPKCKVCPECELTTNDAFYKCHRSYLVHMPAIDHFNSIEIETKTHKKVPIARSYAKSFKEAYFEYMFTTSR